MSEGKRKNTLQKKFVMCHITTLDGRIKLFARLLTVLDSLLDYTFRKLSDDSRQGVPKVVFTRDNADAQTFSRDISIPFAYEIVIFDSCKVFIRAYRRIAGTETRPIVVHTRSQILEYLVRQDVTGFRGLVERTKVNMDLVGDPSCGICSSSLTKTNRRMCCVCSRQICTKCISERKLVIPSMGTFSTVACVSRCMAFLAVLQFNADPWCNCPPGSKALFDLESSISDTSTQLISKLSNLEGLVLTLSNNPIASMHSIVRDLHDSISAGLSSLNGILRRISSVPVPPGKEEQVRHGLASYGQTQLTQLKAQFAIVSRDFQRIAPVR